MCLNEIGLVVALEGAHVRNQEVEVVIRHPRSVCVCARFGIDKGNGHGDMAGPKV